MNNDKLIKVTVSFDTVALAENEEIAINSIINNIEEVVRQEQFDNAIRWEFNDIKTVVDLPRGWSKKDMPWSNKRYSDVTIKDLLFKESQPNKNVIGYYAVVQLLDTGDVKLLQSIEPYDLENALNDNEIKVIEKWTPIFN